MKSTRFSTFALLICLPVAAVQRLPAPTHKGGSVVKLAPARITGAKALQAITPKALFGAAPKNLRYRDATLQWDMNTEPNVTGYKVYFGPSSRGYTNVIDVYNNTWAFVPVFSNTTFYAVTAYDDAGLESGFSLEVSYTPQPTIVVPRTNVTITVLSAPGVSGPWLAITNFVAPTDGVMRIYKVRAD